MLVIEAKELLRTHIVTRGIVNLEQLRLLPGLEKFNAPALADELNVEKKIKIIKVYLGLAAQEILYCSNEAMITCT